MMEYSAYELTIFVVVLLCTGIFAGLGAGLLGIGGGIIIVPVLNEVFKTLDFSHSMHLAIATSLVTIIPTSISAVRSHIKKPSFDKKIFKSWFPFLFIGALIGSFLAKFVDGDILQLFFGIIMAILAINMMQNSSVTIANGLPKNIFIYNSMPTILGAVSAWLGISGGAISVSLFKLFAIDIHKAVATSSGFGLAIAIPGCIGYIYGGFGMDNLPPFSLGYVNVLGALIISSMSIFFAPLGAKLAHQLAPEKLKKIFAWFLVIVAIKMIII